MTKPHRTALGFAAACLAICFYTGGLHFEGSWGGMIPMLLAFPFSFLSIAVAHHVGGGQMAFLMMNAAWWYALVRLFHYARQRSRQTEEPRAPDSNT
jgi:hypothetical protein